MVLKQLRILYLHGFKSSPSSLKAQQTMQYFAQLDLAQNLHIPHLPPEPSLAIEQAMFLYEQLIDEVGIANVFIIGSSLGGYYASYLIERFGGRGALINPAVKPYELLVNYLGENENYHTGEKFVVTKAYMADLKAIEVKHLKQPKQHLLLVQMSDETLDAHEATAKYRNGPSIIECGGNHSYVDFPKRLNTIMNFALADSKNNKT